MVIRGVTLGLFLVAVVSAVAADHSSADKMPCKSDLAPVRRAVEMLRGKKFKHDVPVYDISEKELRAIFNRDVEKDHPGADLATYADFLAWLDVVPPGTDLKAASANLAADQVAALYDSDTKEMCICTYKNAPTDAKRPAEKMLNDVSGWSDEIVLAHEYTHALEDQYWPLEDPKDNDSRTSSDRGGAHNFLAEGSATRLMIDAIPDQSEHDAPGSYFVLWNLIHSGLGQGILRYALGNSWKGEDAEAPGVPEVLARMEAIPYSYGYSFCADTMRKWGLDGLDYVCEHPPISTEQVMHPSKYWEWRDFPVRIELPDNLPGGWKRLTGDNFGESGMAVFFGCQFKNLNRGLDIAQGWDGDIGALYEGAGGKRLVVWASAWDSVPAAKRFADCCVKERELAHEATITRENDRDAEWTRPDGRAGSIMRDGMRVVLLETDQPDGLKNANDYTNAIKFTEPPEDAERATKNATLRRLNPIVAQQRDGDYSVTRTLCGLLTRHDRTSFGSSDRVLLGIAGESRRTSSLNKWELGAGLIGKHQAEARQGISKTTLLPWGVLGSHFSTPLPDAPDTKLERTSVLWGLGGSWTLDGAGQHKLRVLPFGLLFRKTTGAGKSATHVLGTGLTREDSVDQSPSKARFRILGIPVWSRRSGLRKA